jgi:hypothetical protein
MPPSPDVRPAMPRSPLERSDSPSAVATSTLEPDSCPGNSKKSYSRYLVLYSYNGCSNLVLTLAAEDLRGAEAMLAAIKETAALDRGHYGENPDSHGFILPNVKEHLTGDHSGSKTNNDVTAG